MRSLLDSAAARFADLGYAVAGGLLELRLDLGQVQTLRIEPPAGEILQLQSIGIDADGVVALSDVEVRVSGWHADFERAFQPARLFNFDHPTGTIIRTQADQPAWMELRFSRSRTVTRLRLRNVADETAGRARGLRISVGTRWRTRTVYDGAAQLRAWKALVRKAQADTASDPGGPALLDVLDLTVRGAYARAHRSLASKVTDEWDRRWFRAAVNAELLPTRGLEWTAHGPQRPFRLWSEEEQTEYVRDSARVVAALQSLSPYVCLGFGSVLSVVRDGALIPHDDDLDIIVGFEPAGAATLADGLRLIEEHLSPLGYEVTGDFAAHRHVRQPGTKRVDVFAGIFEGESISWYPGARGGLTRAIVFPPVPAQLLGVSCLIPAQPEVYLERVYGPGWRVPDPNFSHTWNLSAYEDITGTRAATMGPPGSKDRPAR